MLEMAYFIALLFAKNMALLPLGEPKIGTENELAPRARKGKAMNDAISISSALFWVS